MKKLAFMFLAACSPTVDVGAPVAYVSACPLSDEDCTRRQNAQTLYYIGEPDAAQLLMCQDKSVAEAIGAGCAIIY